MRKNQGTEPQSGEDSHRTAEPKPHLAASVTASGTHSLESEGNGRSGGTIAPYHCTGNPTTGSLSHTGAADDGRDETAADKGNLQEEGNPLTPSKKRRASVSALGEEEDIA